MGHPELEDPIARQGQVRGVSLLVWGKIKSQLETPSRPPVRAGRRPSPETGRRPGCPQPGPRAEPPAVPILTRQSAAATPVAPVALPSLQNEVGVGSLGDPQRVGQQHLLWIHPHGPGGRGQSHKEARTLARSPGHTRALPPVGAGPRRPSAGCGPRLPARDKDPAGSGERRRGSGPSK